MSLHANLPSDDEVEQKYVEKFHELLDNIEIATDLDLDAFRMPKDDLYPQAGASVSYYSKSARQRVREAEYALQRRASWPVETGRMVVKRNDLVFRLEAARNFLSVPRTEVVKEPIGFQVS